MESIFGKAGLILSVLGALLVLEGIPYFGFPKAVKRWALVLQEIDERTLRIMGLVIMAVGIALLFAVRSI
ncbi:MAG: hypothetical protein A2X93_08665 [Deltaproteobacteria bacterium GWC2_56_8]|nr:MAG: hypothetical protein A2X99_01180 [Deltaproteobacteria bacterium GWB2_55_19]OGP33308.1 MAG: hypothetical protein A2X93_08665 [Deltaproteobacteria bacterium GWC2_56_8]HAO93217.1 DUF2065 domain-containing protein [Deltaproteobacteria bacterium]